MPSFPASSKNISEFDGISLNSVAIAGKAEKQRLRRTVTGDQQEEFKAHRRILAGSLPHGQVYREKWIQKAGYL
ncbi:MAG: hypothetical protein D6681_20655 [Calditrichaeota bacterium]|nr:MAG: hypothetical protein D6681_20655 [Calditrichota bacterium]